MTFDTRNVIIISTACLIVFALLLGAIVQGSANSDKVRIEQIHACSRIENEAVRALCVQGDDS